jgi:two-component system chemotaxis sensor kinase CheA
VRLRRIFDAPGLAPEREQMLVVRHAGLSAGLVVDRLLGEAETTVRPLGSGLAGLSRLGGSTVLRDGRIGLVLDVPTLLRDLVAGAGTSGPAPSASPHVQ